MRCGSHRKNQTQDGGIGSGWEGDGRVAGLCKEGQVEVAKLGRGGGELVFLNLLGLRFPSILASSCKSMKPSKSRHHHPRVILVAHRFQVVFAIILLSS